MPSRPILVPLDGSRFAEAAIPPALGLATSLHEDLTLLAVVEDNPPLSTWTLSAVDAESVLQEYLDAVAQRIAGDRSLSVTVAVAKGSVPRAIEEHAATTKAAVIVMSTHGRGALSRAWLGSVADHVTRHVPVPVMLVRPEEDVEVNLSREHRFGRILVALDGSPEAEESLEWAVRIAKAQDASLGLVRVVPPPLPLTSPYMPHLIAESRDTLEEGRTEAEKNLDDVARRTAGGGGGKPDTRPVVGVSPGSGILREAATWKADLIALTTHARRGLPRLVWGSVADKVIRGADVPVLVTRGPR